MPRHFFIVTACNPDGVDVPVEENKRADGILKEAVDEAGFDAFRVVGGDFEFDHSEPGWGICCGFDDARKLSVKFRQVAFFEVKSGMVRLVPTDPSDGDTVDLGDWSLRLDDGEPCCPFCFTRVMEEPCNHLLTTFDSWGGSWTLEEGFYDGLYGVLVEGGLAEGDPSTEEELRRQQVIRQTLLSVRDYVTYSSLDQGPGFSSEMEFIWTRDPGAAYARLRGLLAAGGIKEEK
ncbi:MAG: DUF3293 domain-containing protein [Luteolibacter sp.]